MLLTGDQRRLLHWVESTRPVIDLSNGMANIKPMIDRGLIVSRPLPASKGQLVITDKGKAVAWLTRRIGDTPEARTL